MAEKDDPCTPIGQYLQKGPAYDISGMVKGKLSAEIIGIMEGCLTEYKAKKLDGRQWQQLRRIDMHERIFVEKTEHVDPLCIQETNI